MDVGYSLRTLAFDSSGESALKSELHVNGNVARSHCVIVSPTGEQHGLTGRRTDGQRIRPKDRAEFAVTSNSKAAEEEETEAETETE
ncbi:hypothetical protein AWZ03_011677 [Drosophila navojoa]|uniref:Uncharacterized protein n=1 Tax=Drosophila navojoa TaxID=7232 RepID=A0A484B277_DRONA|nr:hypothetical protein AWZ03_011677 [Drosophila navojoa]